MGLSLSLQEGCDDEDPSELRFSEDDDLEGRDYSLRLRRERDDLGVESLLDSSLRLRRLLELAVDESLFSSL